MSLETKIDELTKAVNMLTKVIAEQDIVHMQAEQASAPAEKAKPEAAEPVTEQPTARTQDDLKKLCMARVKENREFKDTLKSFLKDAYGVSKTSEVPDDKVTEVYTRIESGDL